MSSVNEGERISLFPHHDIPAPITDNRKAYQKQRAVNFILLITFLERVAFFAFTNTLFAILVLKEAFSWQEQHGKTALYIFAGKFIFV